MVAEYSEIGTRRRAVPAELDEDGAARVVHALLALACRDAVGHGALAADAWAFILSPASRRWAALVGLDAWPPTRAMLIDAHARRWKDEDE